MTFKIDISDKDVKLLLKYIKEIFGSGHHCLCKRARKAPKVPEVAEEEEVVPPQKPAERPEIECANCGKKFKPNLRRAMQRFCCSECGVAYHTRVRREVQEDRAQAKAEVKETVKPVPKEKPKKVLEERACACCGKKFIPSRKNARFCAEKCRLNYFSWKNNGAPKGTPLSQWLAEHGYNGGFEVRECKQCGKKFVPTTVDQKYCSKECKLSYNQVRLTESQGKILCPICNMPFKPIDPAQKYCDKCVSCFGEEECDRMVNDKAQLAAVRAERKKVEQCQYKVCPRCGANFHDPYNKSFFCPKCVAKANKAPKVAPLKKDPSLEEVEV